MNTKLHRCGRAILFLLWIGVSSAAAIEFEEVETKDLLENPQRFWAMGIVFRDTLTEPVSHRDLNVAGTRYQRFTTAVLGYCWAEKSAVPRLQILELNKEYLFSGTVLQRGRRYYVIVRDVKPAVEAREKIDESLRSLLHPSSTVEPEKVNKQIAELLAETEKALYAYAQENNLETSFYTNPGSPHYAKAQEIARGMIAKEETRVGTSSREILLQLLMSALLTSAPAQPAAPPDETPALAPEESQPVSESTPDRGLTTEALPEPLLRAEEVVTMPEHPPEETVVAETSTVEVLDEQFLVEEQAPAASQAMEEVPSAPAPEAAPEHAEFPEIAPSEPVAEQPAIQTESPVVSQAREEASPPPMPEEAIIPESAPPEPVAEQPAFQTEAPVASESLVEAPTAPTLEETPEQAEIPELAPPEQAAEQSTLQTEAPVTSETVETGESTPTPQPEEIPDLKASPIAPRDKTQTTEPPAEKPKLHYSLPSAQIRITKPQPEEPAEEPIADAPVSYENEPVQAEPTPEPALSPEPEPAGLVPAPEQTPPPPPETEEDPNAPVHW